MGTLIPQGKKSWRTSVIGALLGLLTYWQGVGWRVPQTKQEWATLGGSALLLLLGTQTRDETASQQAHAEQQVQIASVEAKAEEKTPVTVQVVTPVVAPPEPPQIVQP